MSDTPRDQDANATSGAAPTPPRPDTGPDASPAPASGPAAPGPATASSATSGPQPTSSATSGPPPTGSATSSSPPTSSGASGPPPTGSGTSGPRTTGSGNSGPGPAGPAARQGGSRAERIAGAAADAESERRRRRKRRLLIGGISAGAAVLVILLCAGLLAAVEAVGDIRDNTSEAHERRARHDADCLTLEERLNRLTPPGATTTPQARATAVRDENAAVRIYVDSLTDGRAQDGWRRLLDARTAYAEALDRQARARTPAFFVAPRTGDEDAVADELIDASPASCAGPVRRLAAPDL